MQIRRQTAAFFCLTVLATLVGCGGNLPQQHVADMQQAMEIRASLESAGGGASADTGPKIDPTGFGTLRGTFKVASTNGLPAPDRLTISGGDASVCAPGNKPVFGESIVVDSASGGIANMLIFLNTDVPQDDPKWVHPSAVGKTEPVVFDQKECRFLTHVVAMQVSQPLKILNSDPVGHNTALAPTRSTPDNQIIPAGGQAVYEHSNQEKQPYPVSCSIHPWMKAYILPRENAYFAVTAADGSFVIPNLPTGVDLEFRVWQERTGFLKEVTLDGNAVKLSSGKLTLSKIKREIPVDGELSLDLTIAPDAFK